MTARHRDIPLSALIVYRIVFLPLTLVYFGERIIEWWKRQDTRPKWDDN